MADPDLDLLFDAAFAPGHVTFVNADIHAGLNALRSRLTCLQDWKPAADRLAAAGFATGPAQTGAQTALVRLGRQRQRNLGWIATAAATLAPGGTLRIAGANALGPARYAKDLASLGLAVQATSKSKARLLHTVCADPGAFAAWAADAAPRRVLDGRFVSAPGVFAWDRIDEGSARLAALLPAALAGRVADLGAGFGFLADAVLTLAPAIDRLDAFEADRVALYCAKQNLARYGARADCRWHDVAAGVGTALYHAVLTNPPFHDTLGEDRGLGLRFIEVAATALKPGGTLYLVANRHLPYEKTLAARFKRVERLSEDAAFKIYAASG
jgi:16S rRNA (guanine1207-N2)-methyltransferase